MVSPAYRLAPEDPFPAAVDDAWAVLQWARDHADEIGGDPERISVMGDSAGGNLAAVVALQARDDSGPRLRSQVLIYPAVDMYQQWPSEKENANAPVLTAAGMHAFVNTYLAAEYGTEDWRASPLRAASHKDLPPTLILTAGHDPIRDHGQPYRDALRSDGVHVDLVNYPDAVHGFLALPGLVPAARTALRDVTAFLRQTL